LEKQLIIDVCQKAGAEVANFNSPQQIVITGQADKVDAACQALKEAGAKNVVPLDVAGAFHSRLMQSAADKFQQELLQYNFKPADIPIVSNVDAKPAVQPEAIRNNLAQQITSSVQWVESVNFMSGQGVTTFIEIGPGKVLKGLLRRIDKSLTVHNIETPEDVAALDL